MIDLELVFSPQHNIYQGCQYEPEKELELPTSRLPTNRQQSLNDSHHLEIAPRETNMMVKLGSDSASSDLDRIQDLFPADNLLLHDRDPLSPRSKHLVRKRSTTASRLQRALSGKNKVVPTEKQGVIANDIIGSGQETIIRPPQCQRSFIMEAPVQLTTGVQSQDRHLFLFNDLLIIAKARTSSTFKLKEKVRVAEIWLSHCLEVVCEVAKNGDISFVMGWPTTNVVATFNSASTRDLWLTKLKQLLTEEQHKEPRLTTIRIHYWDPNTKEEYAHNVSISRKDTVVDCISSALHQLGLSDSDASHYQLWVKTDRESAPYPLIGHESPFAIKMNCLFSALAVSGEESFDFDYCENTNNTSNACPVLKCYFILRTARRGSFDLVSPKKGKRVRRSPILQKVFRRSLSKPELLDTSETNSPPISLFGQPLARLVQDGGLPKSVMEILQKLFEKGPYTVGIFRKSANVRTCREIKEKLDCLDSDCDLEDVNIFVLAALLKEFLRNLPDCLLLCCLYLEWLAVPRLASDVHKVQEVQRLLERLPLSHLTFLRHFMCVLWHIQRRSSENMMSATNLAVCVGPSLLWPNEPNTPTFTEQSEASKQVPTVVEFLIIHCEKIFGDECLSLFGDSSRKDLSRQDSGNEESDSLHSLQSSQSSVGLRRDDSSIDSLEHALLGEGEHSPKLPSKAKMSLTNLSRDSGLTMSDTQLYTPDEEVDSEASSAADSRHGFHGVPSLMGSAMGDTSMLARYRSTDDWRPAKTRSVSCSSAGGDSVCSVDGRPPSQESKRSTIGSTTCLSKNVDVPSVKMNGTTNLKFSSSCPVTGHGNVVFLTQKQQQQQICKRKTVGETKTVTEATSKSLYPLGCRNEVIKRRLSRSRAWIRPLSSYGTPDLQMSEMNGHTALRKSASEESILSNYVEDSYLSYKRPAQHNKGRAPSPPPPQQASFVTSTPTDVLQSSRMVQQLSCTASGMSRRTGLRPVMMRSKSVHQFHSANTEEESAAVVARHPAVPLGRFERRTGSHDNTPMRPADIKPQWQQHGSSAMTAPHVDVGHDFSYDSSTLSDNDSTPHISRSNSRGKDYSAGGSSGGSANLTGNYAVYMDVYGERGCSLGRTSTPPGGGSPRNLRQDADGSSPQPLLNSRARQIYEESVRIYNEQMDSEIHHAAPVRIETSDEELEPPPPLPPKAPALRRSTSAYGGDQVKTTPADRHPSQDETDWYSCASPKILGVDGVINVSGKRVLTMTQSVYDVPPWRTMSRTCSRSPCRQTVTTATTVATNGRGRCAKNLSSNPPSRPLRTKSQPPPEDRKRVPEPIYDYPPPPVRHQPHSRAERCATVSAAMSTRNGGFSSKRNQDCCQRGATVGRTFRKELSWSVSQLKALFTKHKDGGTSNNVGQNMVYEYSNESASLVTGTAAADSKGPPPYRAPPQVEFTEKPAKENRIVTTLGRHCRSSLGNRRSAESLDSTSGGEESYV